MLVKLVILKDGKIIVVFRKFVKQPKGITLYSLLCYCQIVSVLSTRNAQLSTSGIFWGIKAAGS